MLFLPEKDYGEVNRLIYLWSGEYCDTQKLAEDFAVVNCDFGRLEIPRKMTVISCGMSPKATVTASSVTAESFVCCIQRNFVDMRGKLVEPGELCLPLEGTDIGTALFAASANLIINGIFPENRAYDL